MNAEPPGDLEAQSCCDARLDRIEAHRERVIECGPAHRFLSPARAHRVVGFEHERAAELRHVVVLAVFSVEDELACLVQSEAVCES